MLTMHAPQLHPQFKDKFQNLGASLVKQVANATNDVAGDGAPPRGGPCAKLCRLWLSAPPPRRAAQARPRPPC